MVSELIAGRFFAGTNSTVLLLMLAGRFVLPPLVAADGGGGTDGRTGTVAGVIGGECRPWSAAGTLGAEDNDDAERLGHAGVDDDDESEDVVSTGDEDVERDGDGSPEEAVSAHCRGRRDRGWLLSESGCDVSSACVIWARVSRGPGRQL